VSRKCDNGRVMKPQVVRRLFTVEEFHQIAEGGIFREDDRLELVDGEIVEMTPVGRQHAACVKRVNEWCVTRVQASAIVSVQDPIVLNDRTELYPDLALLARRDDFYSDSHPGPADVLLVIEVADTTGRYDRGVVPRYARAGIAEVWVVDLPARAIDVYRQPSGDAYRDTIRAVPGDVLEIPCTPGHRIGVDEILP
jgi:Uma2 family endonuclease